MKGNYAGKSHVHKPEKGLGSYDRKTEEYVFPVLYSVSYTGMDGSWHTVDRDSLLEARQEATWVEEHGGHSIFITDDEGGEYDQ